MGGRFPSKCTLDTKTIPTAPLLAAASDGRGVYLSSAAADGSLGVSIFDISAKAVVSPLDRATQVFAALTSATRCRIIGRLLDSAQPAGVLTEALQLRQSNVSNHLAQLRYVKLVIAERQGRRVIYRLSERDAPLIATMWRRFDLHSDAVIGADAWRAGGAG